jgi:hypothetical protein
MQRLKQLGRSLPGLRVVRVAAEGGRSGGYDVDVDGGSRLTGNRAGDRAANRVHDPERVERTTSLRSGGHAASRAAPEKARPTANSRLRKVSNPRTGISNPNPTSQLPTPNRSRG